MILDYFFKKTRYISQHLFGIRIWIWAVENLGSSHHASIVRDLMYVTVVAMYTVFPHIVSFLNFEIQRPQYINVRKL